MRSPSVSSKPRLRDLGPVVGQFPIGPLNAITDVPGVWVGHTTLRVDGPTVIRTGVTVVVPREGRIWQKPVFAGFHSFNGCGEMTGMHWVAESGMLFAPIALTGTALVGVVHEALGLYAIRQGLTKEFDLPVVGETYDGWMSDISALPLSRQHVWQALETAHSGPVEEGCVGGGTGMVCHEFKGGIGTSSRMVSVTAGNFTVGVLVQANYGVRHDLRLNGFPMGQQLGKQVISSPFEEDTLSSEAGNGSILVVIATDAPLLPFQCKRLAQRATVGLARTGGFGYNGSGDLFLAFATGNQPASGTQPLVPLFMLTNEQLDAFFVAAAEAVEEAIWNALIAAETVTGIHGRVAYAIPHPAVTKLWKKHVKKTY